MSILDNFLRRVVCGGMALAMAGCSSLPDAPSIAPPSVEEDSSYIVGPTDQLQIFVWRQPDLSTNVIVRPDGKISVPLIDDLQASGRTPTELAKDIEKVLSEVVQEPRVTVIVNNFVGPFDRQIRVVGEATQPQAVPFRRNMTMLDLMIQVGGLTEFAAGNDSVIVRRSSSGEQTSYRVRLDDLLNDGDVSANAYVLPGDVVIIPQSWF
jgi:polysaccharide export outer membrane protein